MIPTIKKRILLAMLALTPSCEEITMLVSKSLDARLTLAERLQLRLHMWICAACKRFSIQLHALHDVIHAHGLPEAHEIHDVHGVHHNVQNAPSLAHHTTTTLSTMLSDEAKQRMKETISGAL